MEKLIKIELYGLNVVLGVIVMIGISGGNGMEIWKKPMENT